MRDVDFGVCLLLFFLFFLSLGSVCGVGGDYIWRGIWGHSTLIIRCLVVRLWILMLNVFLFLFFL